MILTIKLLNLQINVYERKYTLRIDDNKFKINLIIT